MRRFIINFFGSFILVFFIVSISYGINLKSNEDLNKVISLTGADLKSFLVKIESAKKVVEKREEKKKRKLRFKNPVKYFDISDKYSVAAYGAEYESGENSIVAFLLIKSNEDILIHGKHLIWKGDADLASFENMDDNILSKYFREMGVKDIYPVFSQMKIKKSINSKADIDHKHKAEDIVSGILLEKFIDQSITRDEELKEALSKKADISMVLTKNKNEESKVSVEDSQTLNILQSKIEELELKLARLQFILNGVTRKKNEIYFNNINLHVINGSGSTESSNGTGNIVVGYNEGGNVSGSHNIVVGKNNGVFSYGGIVTGNKNRVEGEYGAAIGGNKNLVTKAYGIAVGGEGNKALGKFSTVAGGEKNSAKGDFSIIAGGKNRSVLNENPHFTQ